MTAVQPVPTERCRHVFELLDGHHAQCSLEEEHPRLHIASEELEDVVIFWKSGGMFDVEISRVPQKSHVQEVIQW